MRYLGFPQHREPDDLEGQVMVGLHDAICKEVDRMDKKSKKKS